MHQDIILFVSNYFQETVASVLARILYIEDAARLTLIPAKPSVCRQFCNNLLPIVFSAGDKVGMSEKLFGSPAYHKAMKE